MRDRCPSWIRCSRNALGANPVRTCLSTRAPRCRHRPVKAGVNDRVFVPGGVAKKKLLQSFAQVAVMVPDPLIFIAKGG